MAGHFFTADGCGTGGNCFKNGMKSIIVVHATECMATGVLSLLREIVAVQRQMGCRVILVYCETEETPDNLQALFGPEVRLVPSPGKRRSSVLRLLRFILKLNAEVRRVRPDVVHLHSSFAGALGRIFLRAENLIYSPHGLSFVRTDTGKNKLRFFRALEARLGRVGSVVASSRSEFEALKPLKVNRLFHVDNGIAADTLPQSKIFHRQKNDRVCVLTVGGIRPQKGVDFYLEVVKNVRQLLAKKNLPLPAFVWVGGGEPGLERQLRFAGVTVTGWISRAEVIRELVDASAYLHTAAWEGMPVAVIEALIVGLPVVARDAVGTRDVVRDQHNGFLCESPECAAQRLVQCLEDFELSAVLSNRASSDGRMRFSIKRTVSELQSIYIDTMTP